jgi:nicotinamide-nucleotide amidase
MTNDLEQLAQHLGNLLLQKDLRLATAESCTGGGLGFWITSIAGSSAWYDRGFITYSNAAKMELLQVKPITLDKFGAVSRETALEMAEGALHYSQADVSVAITGIAGPDGGSPDKPVGTVWIAYAGKSFSTEAHLEVFAGDRQKVRTTTIQRALQHLATLIHHA